MITGLITILGALALVRVYEGKITKGAEDSDYGYQRGAIRSWGLSIHTLSLP